jgi:hypothetical protein
VLVNLIMAAKFSHVARNTALKTLLVQVWALKLILAALELKPAELASSVLTFAI